MSDLQEQAEMQIDKMEEYITHIPDAEGPEEYIIHDNEGWRCFQCGEYFGYGQEDAARKHFGVLPPSMPACWYGKDALVALLRAYEEQNRTLLNVITALLTDSEDDNDD